MPLTQTYQAKSQSTTESLSTEPEAKPCKSCTPGATPTAPQYVIECSICKDWVHMSCSKLPLYQLYIFHSTKRTYICEGCTVVEALFASALTATTETVSVEEPIIHHVEQATQCEQYERQNASVQTSKVKESGTVTRDNDTSNTIAACISGITSVRDLVQELEDKFVKEIILSLKENSRLKEEIWQRDIAQVRKELEQCRTEKNKVLQEQSQHRCQQSEENVKQLQQLRGRLLHTEAQAAKVKADLNAEVMILHEKAAKAEKAMKESQIHSDKAFSLKCAEIDKYQSWLTQKNALIEEMEGKNRRLISQLDSMNDRYIEQISQPQVSPLMPSVHVQSPGPVQSPNIPTQQQQGPSQRHNPGTPRHLSQETHVKQVYDSPPQSQPPRPPPPPQRKEKKPTQNRPNVVIMGNSVMKNIDPSRLLRDCEVLKVPAMTVSEGVKKVKAHTGKHPDCAVLHIIENEVGKGTVRTAEACVANVSKLVTEFKSKFPHTKVILSLAPARGDSKPLSLLSERVNVDLKLKYHDSADVSVCCNSNMSVRGQPVRRFFMPDMVHPSVQGTIRLAANIRGTILDTLKLHRGPNRQGARVSI